MSRSYKKNPVGKISSNYDKKLANRKVRRYKNDEDKIIDGCIYKRYYPQWDICDVWTRHTWNDQIKSIKWIYAKPYHWKKSKDTNDDGTPNMKYWFHRWFKYYRMK